jgi:hypothetical protein
LVANGFVCIGFDEPVGLVGHVGHIRLVEVIWLVGLFSNELTYYNFTVRSLWLAAEVQLWAMQLKLCTMAMEILFIGLRLQIDPQVVHHK